jgi:ubiquinone/menaquinone biosynthesis C-methylase UbiE
MDKVSFVLLVLVTALPFASCKSQEKSSQEVYTYKNGDRNGTGKWYMGREIAFVMGYQGIDWLERNTREQEESTSVLLRNMDIQKVDVIADIGAGSGYHVFKMAPKAKQGRIYAVDIQEEMLATIEKKMKRKRVENIELVQGSEQSVNLPANSIDKFLMVDVYHEFAFPVEMMASVKSAMKPDGKLYLIEYKGEDPTIPIKKVHKMTEAQAVLEMEAAGFKLEKNIENLPWQHCMIFVKSE